MMNKKILWITFVTFLSGVCVAQSRFDKDFLEDSNPAPAVEKFEFPKIPESQNLRTFSPSAAGNTIDFFLDEKSIKIISDDVIQFTVVLKSKSGAKQTVFAAIDCNQAQWRQYGFLTVDNTWRENSDPVWKKLPSIGLNQYATYLAKAGLCQGAGPNYDTKRAIKTIQEQELPSS